jgi:hypothetical protein
MDGGRSRFAVLASRFVFKFGSSSGFGSFIARTPNAERRTEP